VIAPLKLTIAYDGTDFVGWQRQPAGVSIQGLIEDALAPIEGGRVTLHGAGRTDAGVHALGQVASAALASTLDPDTIARALNAVLPAAVRIVGAERAHPGFHARFDAVSKTYEYRIVNAPCVSPFLHRYAWHVPQRRLDLERMREAALALAGRHDFASFESAGGDVHTTERTIHAIEWLGERGHDRALVLRVRGDGFLRHMVRNIAGTLVEVGLGRWPPSSVAEILAARDRTRAGLAAPAAGLFLVSVEY
jgi:tRNA pseudouridine38-40 synthase